MINVGDILLVLKYIIAILVLVCIMFAPIVFAAKNGKDKLDTIRTRAGILLFGWTFVGWFVSLFISAKK